ncbi:MAG: class I SAM-dependent methyltransferase [Sphingomicrobium sp.]
MTGPGLKRRAQRALERQLDYQRLKSARVRGTEAGIIVAMIQRSREVREKLERIRVLPAGISALEVGSGAHGLIFYFEAEERVGVDPLADHYRALFPAWQSRAKTIAAGGEQLPCPSESFDVVLCDNVVDHAENPRKICEEMARVLRPGGLLYFTVNIHHPAYHLASSLHAAWRSVGVPFEITPFADHTVHLTLDAARRLFDELPLQIIEESDTIAASRRAEWIGQRRHLGDRLKRWFFKNARWEVIAVKESELAPPPPAP